MAFSQHNEEDYILEYFDDYIGHFIDIGANDGITFSNTACLAAQNWSGHMIEPHKSAFKHCVMNYADNDKIKVVNCAISDKSGPATFYSCTDSMYSTLQARHTITFNNQQFIKTKVRAITFEMLLKAENITKYDFISVDAEEEDYHIIKQIDLTHCKMICFEKNEELKMIQDYCKQFKMNKYAETQYNILYARY